jgi:hypothetical protein
MSKLSISTHVEDGYLVVRLNDAVIIEGSSKYEAGLLPGGHVLQWYVYGKPGTSYSISISSPESAEFQVTKKLRMMGRDCGGFDLIS